MSAAKACSKCGETKPLEEFTRDSSRRDGRCPQCKSCRKSVWRIWYRKNRERRQEYYRRWREANKEKKREYDRCWREENYERYLEYSRLWYQENKKRAREYHYLYRKENIKKRREYDRCWYEDNRKYALQRVREWQQENPRKVLAQIQRRRARKASAQGDHTASQWEELCEAYGNMCLCCGEEKPLTVDHVIPLSKGGTNDICNIQPLCRSCNSRKGTKTTDYRPLFDKDIEELGETG